MPQRPPRSTIALFLAMALLLSALLVPAATAQYAVGTADTVFSDPDRGGRAVPCDLYYPALAAGAGQPVAAPPPEGFAAVAFGHGYQIAAGNYAWIAQRLAALGCVVAAPRTAGELFPDHAAFGLDLAFVARALRDAGQDAGSALFGRMGPRTLVIGHSMGGGASFLAAAGDPSLTAVANLAAAETNPSAVAACGQIDRPALLFAGTADCVTPPADHQIPMFEALTGWRTLVTLTGASHCQFNSYSFLCALGESCSPGISRQEQQDRVWLLLRPWVRWELFLDATAAQEFQVLLAAGGGFTYLQGGAPVGAPAASPGPGFRLGALPNPFRSATALQASVPVAGPVRLEIFDPRGRRVRTLAQGTLEPGRYVFRWDGKDASGRDAPAGVYLARLSGGAGTAGAELALVR
jgi:pimeloyl-ACP methyl ester carboxylesterase